MERYQINMSCGQTSLYSKCLKALGTQLQTPVGLDDGPENAYHAITMLEKLFNTKGTLAMLAGSATYGLESAMGSVMEPGEKVLTVNSGVYGQVLADLARIVGAEPIEIKVPHGKAVDPEAVRRRLAEDDRIKMVAVVHVETSMGSVNPVDKIGELVREFPDVLFMVDAVSSLGGTEVRVDDWGIDLCCSSSQKCLNAPQGIAPIAVSDRARTKIENRKTPLPTLCLDLTIWDTEGTKMSYRRLMGEEVEILRRPERSDVHHKIAHGPGPSYALLRGLRASLEEIFEEGPENVFRRHRIAARAVREGVRAIGLRVLADEEVAAPVCTTVIWPEGCDPAVLGLKLHEEEGVTLAIHRIGHMGFVADRKYVLPTISALERTMRSMGYDVEMGAGVAAANRVFAEEGVR